MIFEKNHKLANKLVLNEALGPLELFLYHLGLGRTADCYSDLKGLISLVKTRTACLMYMQMSNISPQFSESCENGPCERNLVFSPSANTHTQLMHKISKLNFNLFIKFWPSLVINYTFISIREEQSE